MRPGEQRWSRLTLLEGRQLATYLSRDRQAQAPGWVQQPKSCFRSVAVSWISIVVQCAQSPGTGTATPCDLTQALHCSDLQSLALHRAVVLALGALTVTVGETSDRISGWPHSFVMLVTASDY